MSRWDLSPTTDGRTAMLRTCGRTALALGFLTLAPLGVSIAAAQRTAPIVVDHRSTTLAAVPAEWIARAKSDLVIAYGHTSHGSQIVDGMTGLVDFAGSSYAWNGDGSGGALQLRDTPFASAYDLGNPDRTAWSAATRSYLNAHPEVNVIVWS